MNERDTEDILESALRASGWITGADQKGRNVYRQTPRTAEEKKRLGKKRPDFILYGSSWSPIAVAETKKPSCKKLGDALSQAVGYAELLGAPIAFVFSKNAFISHHLEEKASLSIDEMEVRQIPSPDVLEKFVAQKSSSIYQTERTKINSRKDLISVFEYANRQLRSAGITIGVARFSEFANLLFLKLVSEQGNSLGFRIPEFIAWDSYKNKKGDELLNYINGIVIPKLDELFRTRENESLFEKMKLADSQALCNIIAKLDQLDISGISTDIKGDAFEYFIQKYNSGNKDLGEYFTPRHIVNFIVRLAGIEFGEKVYDPFCGTGGMLIAAFAHLREKLSARNLLQESIVRELRENTLYGAEKTQAAKIAKMNMILTGDGHSNIVQHDSFANPVSERFDVVISNIPFSQKGAGAGLYDIETNSGDSQAVQHILKSLKNAANARAYAIVPEGVLNNSEFAGLRRKLLRDGNLQGVVSLPCGVFLPYTEAKTSILCLRKKCDNSSVFFFTVQNDGYTRTIRRRKIDGITDFDEFLELELDTCGAAEHEKLTWVEKGDILKTANATLLSFKYSQSLLDGNVWLGSVIRETNEKNAEQHRTATVSNESYWGIPLGENYWGDNFASVTSEENVGYKVVKKFQFAYNPSRINVGSVVMNTSDTPVAVSSAYTTFEVRGDDYMPEYIFLLLRYSDIRHEIKSRSFGTVRQTLSFEDLASIQFRAVSPEEQRLAVDRYADAFRRYEEAKREMDGFLVGQ